MFEIAYRKLISFLGTKKKTWQGIGNILPESDA